MFLISSISAFVWTFIINWNWKRRTSLRKGWIFSCHWHLEWSNKKEKAWSQCQQRHEIWYLFGKRTQRMDSKRQTWNTSLMFNPFPHIGAFWCLCSRLLFKNIVTKEEIAQNKQFLLLPQYFPLLVIFYDYPFNYRDFLFLAHLSFAQGELLWLPFVRRASTSSPQ